MDMQPNETPSARVVREIDALMRSRHPLIAVNTYEEGRLWDALLGLVAGRPAYATRGLYRWSVVSGLTQHFGPGVVAPAVKKIDGQEDAAEVLKYIAEADEGIFVLCDYSPWLVRHGEAAPMIARMLRELARDIKGKKVNVIFLDPEFPRVDTLEKGELTVVDLPLPSEEEMGEYVDREIADLSSHPSVTVDVNEDTRHRIIQSLLGLTAAEAQNALAKAGVVYRGMNPKSIGIILQEKAKVIKRSGALSYSDPVPVEDIGGYRDLKTLLRRAATTYTPEARKFGVQQSKGFLLIGLPGTGKSLAVLASGSVLGRPVVQLDMGSVMGEGGGVIGTPEASIKRAFDLADVLHPVLGINEFDKAMVGGESSGRSDAGTTARVLSRVLNWMQEQRGTFVVATANDVSGLAPEQIRLGRFEKIIFVDLPTEEDREEILAVHLRKLLSPVGRTWDHIDLAVCARASGGEGEGLGFSGSELEAAVKEAVLDAFIEGAERVETEHLLRAIDGITPLAVTKKDEIKRIRDYAFEHLGAVRASQALEQAAGDGDGKIRRLYEI